MAARTQSRPALRSSQSELPPRRRSSFHSESSDTHSQDALPSPSQPQQQFTSTSPTTFQPNPTSATHGQDPSTATDALSSSTLPLPLPLPEMMTLSLISLRDALLNYLSEVEELVRARIQGGQEALGEGGVGVEYIDAAAGQVEGSGLQAESGSTLRNRQRPLSHPHSNPTSLRRRLSSTTSNLPSPEALLAHLASIREDVISSLPFPQLHIPHGYGFGLAESGRSALNALKEGGGLAARRLPMPLFLSSLPGRLSVLHDHLPALMPSGSDDQPSTSQYPYTTPLHLSLQAFSSRLQLANRKRLRDLIKSVLPSEDWSGWEKLGWEDYDEDEDEEEDLQGWLQGSGNGHGSVWAGMGGSRLERSRSHPVKTDEYSNTTATHPYKTHQSSSSESHLPLLLARAAEADATDPDGDEEPEYLFPNKTPRAAMRRQQSYAAKREARRRVRSKSWGVWEGERERRRRLVGSGQGEGDDGSVNGVGEKGEVISLTGEVELDLELEREMELELEREMELENDPSAPPLDVGPTVHEALIKSENGKRLIDYEDLPWWVRNNEYILGGYRFIPLDSKTGPMRLIGSAFTWHNETINIHSHFIPSVLLICLIIPYKILYNPPLADPAPLDLLTLLAFLSSATACLMSSASWHTISGCSRRRVFEWGACVDWLISCSIHTVYYNGFYCQGRPLFIYTLFTLASAIAGSIAPFQPAFNERKNKKYRIAFFLAICLTAIAPMTHLAIQHGVGRMVVFASPILPSVFAYVFGLCFYAVHFPESKRPGRFDFIGHSHQIWHIAILFGIYLHYTGTLTVFNSRHSLSCARVDAGAPMSSYLRGWGRWLGLRQGEVGLVG